MLVNDTFVDYENPLHGFVRYLNPRMGFWSTALFAFLWSTVKYTVGVAVAFTGFHNPLWGFLFTFMGAAVGIVFFTYVELWLEDHFNRWFKAKKVFSKTSRKLVRMKQRGGLVLVAFLTPVILSIPVGCLLATAFVHSRKKIIVYQLASIMLWGLLFFGLQGLFGFNLMDLMKKLF